MREIIFRGKSRRTGEWVEGFYIKDGLSEFILEVDKSPRPITEAKPSFIKNFVRAATAGQFTGLTDKNGTRIFEGDIVKTHYANAVKADFVELVVFHSGKYCGMAELQGGGRIFAPLADGVPHDPRDRSVYMDCVEVIGNIHDNPELIEREARK